MQILNVNSEIRIPEARPAPLRHARSAASATARQRGERKAEFRRPVWTLAARYRKWREAEDRNGSLLASGFGFPSDFGLRVSDLTRNHRCNSLPALAALLLTGAHLEKSAQAAEETLFLARPLTAENSFTTGIEGPACDAQGNIYAVNFERPQTIGKVTPDGKGEVFVELPGNSIGNGIVIGRDGTMYVADYVGHNILRIAPKSRAVSVWAHDDRMNQPNDLAIAPSGSLYASDPSWKDGTGQVWLATPAGKLSLVATNLGTSNGIEVSPDAKILYVNESVQRNVWAFIIEPDGSLTHKRLLKKFDTHGFDGMRCDVDGNLYITRHGKGKVVKLSPAGEVLREVDVLGSKPSNLCFGGPDGRTVYVTEVGHRRLVQFRVDRPGLAFARLSTAESSR